MFFLTIIIIGILSGAEVDLFVPSFPQLQEVFSLSPFMVELSLSVNLVAHCLAALVTGNLGDKYGRKPVMVIGLIIFVLGSILCVFAPNYMTLLMGRFLQGVGISGPTVLLFIIIFDKYPKTQHQGLMGLVNGIITIAMACAPVVGSYINLFFNWRGNFAFLLIHGILALLLTIIYVPDSKHRQNIKISLLEYIPIFKSTKAVLYLIVLSFACQAYWVFIGMSPIYYMEGLQVSLEKFGLYQGAIAGVFSIGCLSMSYFLKKFGSKNCFLFCSILVAIFFISVIIITFAGVKDPNITTLVMLIQAISMSYPLNILWPYALKSVPNAEGRMGALLVTTRLGFSAIALQITSYYYNGSFFAIGTTIYITLSIAMLACYILIKCYNVLEDNYTD